jgi:KDO2-lipid IV(A) lauroyltransferase
MAPKHTPFLYLPDQDFGARDSVFVKFFEKDAATITGLSHQQAGQGARGSLDCSPCGNRFELEFYPVWKTTRRMM